ncbi:MAG: hypothetical protein AB2747_05310 [Candidatus Thiodiazotropha taylori]
MINPAQFREYVVLPVLIGLGAWSPSAEALIMGTAAVESDLGLYLRQVGGPALGVMQMEPATHNDIVNNYLMHRQLMWRDLVDVTGVDGLKANNLVTNLAYSVAMARVHYLRQPEALPHANDIEGLGRYWKAHYNTRKGRGTVEKFVDSYQQIVGGAVRC